MRLVSFLTEYVGAMVTYPQHVLSTTQIVVCHSTYQLIFAYLVTSALLGLIVGWIVWMGSWMD